MPPRRQEPIPEPGQSYQDALFELPVEQVSLEAFAAQVAEERARNTASREPQAEQSQQSDEAARKSPHEGGAFGGAIKRRIERTDSAEKYSATNEADIALLTPLSISRELFTPWGDQSFKGVVLTPAEHTAVTFSAEVLSRRLGGRVLANTTERPASDRQARKAEVVMNGLLSQRAKAELVLADLGTDLRVFETLAKEARSPGYAHMSGEKMDGLMAHAEQNFISMFEAITTNHGAGTERVVSLAAALDYLLSDNDYRKTFSYWRHMTNVGIDWTRAKRARFQDVLADVGAEIAKRT